jgi:hypothetical protein
MGRGQFLGECVDKPTNPAPKLALPPHDVGMRLLLPVAAGLLVILLVIGCWELLR